MQSLLEMGTPNSKQCICNSVHNCVPTLLGEVVASVCKGPYLHHTTTVTLLPCSRIHLESPDCVVVFREG